MQRNVFGGGNKNSLYTPMSEDEQEVLARLVQTRDLQVRILGWGAIDAVQASFGDLRIDIPIQITFTKPDNPVSVSFFDLELRTGSGILLFKERQSVVYQGQPLAVGRGTTLSMVWTIAIQAMTPELVKALKPGAIGLTSRWLDKDTGRITFKGNTKMSSEKMALLRKLRMGELKVKRDQRNKVFGGSSK